eukprot:20963-Heterococcus_DN1.PRE.1
MAVCSAMAEVCCVKPTMMQLYFWTVPQAICERCRLNIFVGDIYGAHFLCVTLFSRPTLVQSSAAFQETVTSRPNGWGTVQKKVAVGGIRAGPAKNRIFCIRPPQCDFLASYSLLASLLFRTACVYDTYARRHACRSATANFHEHEKKSEKKTLLPAAVMPQQA